jgi:hypothetical protein
MLSFTQQSPSLGDRDDKYGKAALKPGVLSELFQSSFKTYTCFLMVGSVIYYFLGGNILAAAIEDKLAYASCIAEGFGLVSLRTKIEKQQSVTGISGMCMIMYALVYFLRLIMVVPTQLSLIFIDGWAVEALQLVSFAMVVDVVRSVFLAYRKSYQDDLDICHVKYLAPACTAIAAVMHPLFSQGHAYSICWTTYLYLDCMALMPQVVMMARGGGKVEAPVSHFVAATAMSRVVDLSFWYYDFDLGAQGYVRGFNYSGWLIVLWHVINLAIVADFMYYYVKARVAGKNMSEDLSLPVADIC